MSVYVACEEPAESLQPELEQPAVNDHPDHHTGVKWNDRLFNVAIIAVPTLVALPLAIWALKCLGLNILPTYSSTLISFYVLIIVSAIGIIYFLISALTIPKASLIGEGDNFIELTTAVDAVRPPADREHRLSQPLVASG